MNDQMRKEFEAWAGPYGHDISRSEINPEDYHCQETEWAYDAWQAARRAEHEKVEPVAEVVTVGGYPDESEHTVRWLAKYSQIKAGDKLYLAPVEQSQEGAGHE